MSRSKSELNAEVVTTTISANSVTVINTTAKKIGVVRYLQLYPQDPYVEQAMKSQYKTATKTVEEWDKVCASIKKKLGVN